MNKNFKRFLFLFTYAIIMAILLILGHRHSFRLERISSSRFDFRPFIIYIAIFPIFMGMMFGLPYIVTQVRKIGKWKYDVIKFFAIGIPSLYLIGSYLHPFFIPFLHHIYPFEGEMALHSKSLLTISSFVFGFFALTSLYKSDISIREQEK